MDTASSLVGPEEGTGLHLHAHVKIQYQNNLLDTGGVVSNYQLLASEKEKDVCFSVTLIWLPFWKLMHLFIKNTFPRFFKVRTKETVDKG